MRDGADILMFIGCASLHVPINAVCVLELKLVRYDFMGESVSGDNKQHNVFKSFGVMATSNFVIRHCVFGEGRYHSISCLLVIAYS